MEDFHGLFRVGSNEQPIRLMGSADFLSTEKKSLWMLLLRICTRPHGLYAVSPSSPALHQVSMLGTLPFFCPMVAAPLTADQIHDLAALLPQWTLVNDTLQRELRFADFVEAFAFMTKVALIAEAMGHHPEWSNVWNRVTIALTTHDTGGLSNLDLEMARRIDALVD